MDIRNKISEMTLTEKCGQLIASGFRSTEDLTPTIKDALVKGRIGTIMFNCTNNFRNALQLKELSCKVLEAAASSSLKIPPFISADQESGQLAVVYDIHVHPGNMALSAIKNNAEDYCYKAGEITAKELKTLGINLNLAPVLDLAHEEGFPVKDNRYFGSDPERTGLLGAAVVRGLQENGVAACAKHFPGQRNVKVDSHFKLDVIDTPKELLLKRELVPFIMAVKSGVEMIMSIHAAFPGLEENRELPATLSPAIINGFLRGELGFKGLVITDDMRMKPIADAYGIENAVIMALNAGVDIILTGNEEYDTFRIIEDAVKKKALSEDTVNTSVNRILRVKKKYILQDFDDRKKTLSILNNADSEIFVNNAARKSITAYNKGKADYPLKVEKNQILSILRPPFVRLVMSDNSNLRDFSFKEIFKEYVPDVYEYYYSIDPVENELLGFYDYSVKSDYILFCTYNAFEFTKQIQALNLLLSSMDPEKLIVAVLRSPADLRIIPEKIKNIFLTYGVTRPSVKALAECMFGNTAPEGILPVNVNKYKLKNNDSGDSEKLNIIF